jgi:hypothetical protein
MHAPILFYIFASHSLSQAWCGHAFQPVCRVFYCIRGGGRLPDIDNDLRKAFPAHFDFTLVKDIFDLDDIFLLADHFLCELVLKFVQLPLLHDVVESCHIINDQENVKAQQVGESPGFQSVHDDKDVGKYEKVGREVPLWTVEEGQEVYGDSKEEE